MRTTRPTRSFTLGLALAAAVLAARPAAAQYLIDTGPGLSTSIGQNSLFSSGSTSCSPQPQCAAAFQFLGGQFTLTEAATLTSIEAWMGPVGAGASLRVKIRADVNGLPSTSPPIFFNPNSIYSKDYTFTPGGAPQSTATFGWATFPQYDAVLAAGTYWVTFEPVSAMNTTMPGSAPSPLAKTAFFGNGNPGYLALNQASANSRLGIRIAGTKFSGIAFGTGSRVIASGSSFSGCGIACGFNYDRISGGTSPFSPYEGDALTTDYIFHTPGAMVHGNGKLIQNGQKAGAYAVADLATAAGRGISFRTYMNVSTTPKTFQANAILHGAFFGTGGTARGAIHIFDSTGFKDAIAAATPLSPAQFLLQSDGAGAISNPNTNISLARLFPAAAVLESELVTANFPSGQASQVPMQTGFVTVQPGEAITVLYDVAVYSNSGGDVNFSNTLSPAANQFTDVNLATVPEMVAVGPSAPIAPTANAVALTPASATTALGALHNIIAAVTTNGSPVADAPVTVTISSGPNAGLVVQASTDASGTVTVSYTSSSLGTDSISAASGALQSNVVENTWVPGAIDHMTISPSSSSITSGGSQAYTAEGFDFFNNSLGDLTSSTAFSIAPDGSCSLASCTASVAGSHTVTGSIGAISDTATLDVTGGGGGHYQFQGFFWLIDAPANGIAWNVAKAGLPAPILWRLRLNGQPVSNRSSFVGLFSYSVSCTTGAGAASNAVPGTGATNPALWYWGLGVWEFNWKTTASYKNTCRAMYVTFDDGTTSPTEYFKFK